MGSSQIQEAEETAIHTYGDGDRSVDSWIARALRDILHVMKVLGHKNINNTLVYTQLVDLADDEYISRVAKTVDEVRQLVESGFEYISTIEDTQIYRKRK